MRHATMIQEQPVIQDQQEREFWNASYWDAVISHDASMDGVFVYAVRTTGVYCRPSCPSRRPKRENVVLFKERRAARNAGFRPCLRCTPDADHKGDPQARMWSASAAISTSIWMSR